MYDGTIYLYSTRLLSSFYLGHKNCTSSKSKRGYNMWQKKYCQGLLDFTFCCNAKKLR